MKICGCLNFVDQIYSWCDTRARLKPVVMELDGKCILLTEGVLKGRRRELCGCLSYVFCV